MTEVFDLVSAVDASWFGAGLPEASMNRLASLFRTYEALAHARLLREGDETRELSLLLRGRAALGQRVSGQGSVTIINADPGDVFGWTAIVPPFRATSTVTSMEPVTVLAFDGARLRRLLRNDRELAASLYQQVLEAVVRRLLATRQQLLDVYRAEAIEPW